MQAPDMTRIVETFIPIPMNPEDTAISAWQTYLELLRNTVAPLVRDLTESGKIEWYSFLLHNARSGVPTQESGNGLYVHLRLERSHGVDEPTLVAALPEVCEMTRPIQVPDHPSLDSVEISALLGGRVEQGWKILGESSQWVLSMLDGHDPSMRIPAQNVAQFLHYTGNQLMVRVVGIPMP